MNTLSLAAAACFVQAPYHDRTLLHSSKLTHNSYSTLWGIARSLRVFLMILRLGQPRDYSEKKSPNQAHRGSGRMNVGVLGSGPVARVLAAGVLKHGHQVTVVLRSVASGLSTSLAARSRS